MDKFIMDIVLNMDYLPYYETLPIIMEGGGSVELTNQLAAAIQGYVDLNAIEDAIPTSVTIDSLPACGVLYRDTVGQHEEEFAIFWSFDTVEGFYVQA